MVYGKISAGGLHSRPAGLVLYNPYKKFHAWTNRSMRISCMEFLNFYSWMWSFHPWKWIFSPQKCSRAVGLYTTSCKEFPPMNILRQNFLFDAWNSRFHAWKFHFYSWKFYFHKKYSCMKNFRIQLFHAWNFFYPPGSFVMKMVPGKMSASIWLSSDPYVASSAGLKQTSCRTPLSQQGELIMSSSLYAMFYLI